MEQNNHQDHPQQDHSRPQHWFRKGAAAAWPICLGYLPVGLACGALAQQAGLPFWAVGLMSILVFAGSAQFIAISMLAAGASPISIILTTFIVNLRHTLMSSTLAVYLQGVNRWFLSLFAYGVTDESFAVNMTRFRTGEWNRWQALTVNHLSNSAWVAATTCGALVGQLIPERALGMDYLRRSLETASGDARLAFAGYNGGIGVIGRLESRWPAETIRYAYWGSGIYADATQNRAASTRLDEWLKAGGASLCAKARQRLGINP